jgi:hypothetical protein
MNDIIFNRGRGGLGRALAGKDHYSGIVTALAAAELGGLTLADKTVKTIYSVQDAEDLGIKYVGTLGTDELRYLIDTIYQQNDKAVVYIGFFDKDDAGFSLSNNIKTLQNESGGELRQAIVSEVYKDFAIANLTPIQSACDTLEAEHKPLSIIYTCNFSSYGFASAGDLRALDSKNISVAYGMDGNGKGAELFSNYGKSITCAGAILGVLSSAKVNENIGWVGQFNVNSNDDNEFDVLTLADGSTLKDLSEAAKDALNTKGFIFLIKHIGKAGSYFNDSHTCILSSSDFAYMENNRTIDKAVRNARTFLMPNLNAPLFVNEDGTLTEDTIATFKNDGSRALEELQRNLEISAFSVNIDPAQDVLTSSKIALTLKIVPVGVARNIVVNIGFAVRVDNV